MFCQVSLFYVLCHNLHTPGPGPIRLNLPRRILQRLERTRSSRNTETIIPLDAARRRRISSLAHQKSCTSYNSVRAENRFALSLADALRLEHRESQVHFCTLWYLTAEKSLLMAT